MLLPDVELLRRLVHIDSTSAISNLPIAAEIASYLDSFAEEIAFIDDPDEEKANLLIRFGPAVAPASAGDGGGLMLSGHMDAVPALEKEWESDPFVLTDRGDRLAGRGTADMKGFLAVAANAAASIRHLKKPLYLLFTYDEEAGTRGARHFVEQWDRTRPLPWHCVIGEPTEFRTVRTHKGHLKLRITTTGRSAHSGYPHLGENAIEKMTPVLEALTDLRHDLEAERGPHSDLFPDAPFVPLNLATIRGGTAVNIVPDGCEVEVGIRLLPGMKTDEMVHRIRRSIGSAQLEVVNDSPPMLLETSSEVYRVAKELTKPSSGASRHLLPEGEGDQRAGSRTDLPLPLAGEGGPKGRVRASAESVNFASDAGWLQTMGIECILFGPGSIEVAHRANEFVPKADLVRAAELTRQIIQRFCT